MTFSFSFHGSKLAQLRHQCIASGEVACRDHIAMTRRAYSRHLSEVHGWLLKDERRAKLLVEWMRLRSLKVKDGE